MTAPTYARADVPTMFERRADGLTSTTYPTSAPLFRAFRLVMVELGMRPTDAAYLITEEGSR